jgi:hypothetical protein
MILTLSAWPLRGQPQALSLSASAQDTASFHNAAAFHAELLPIKRTVMPLAAQGAPREEPPAPALLVYLALILVGSAGSVALARRRLHG